MNLEALTLFLTCKLFTFAVYNSDNFGEHSGELVHSSSSHSTKAQFSCNLNLILIQFLPLNMTYSHDYCG